MKRIFEITCAVGRFVWGCLLALWDVFYGEDSHSANRYRGR